MNEQNGKKIFYRLRSLKSIFDYKELENQEVYFAPLSKLNDPMEGFINIIFKGDYRDWAIFFVQYLKCFEWAYLRLNESDGEYDILNNLQDMYEWVIKTQYSDPISKRFLEISDKAIEKIASRTTPINQDELLFYLESMYYIILKLMHKHYNPNHAKELPHSNDEFVDIIIKTIDEIEGCIKHKGEQEVQECLKTIIAKRSPMHLDFSVIGKMNLNNSNVFAPFHFSHRYLSAFKEILYLQYRVACFMEEASNSSVWAHYADAHKGICLMFETTGQSLTFREKREVTPLRKMKYSSFPQSINFFELMREIPQKKKEKLRDTLFTKTNDWSYEKEYRIVANTLANERIDIKDVRLKYNFKDLHGIIFGINTSLEDKLKVMNIIKQKCKNENRKDFKFYQAYFCQKNNNIQHAPIEFK